MKADAILFDLDGTLWNSVDGILKTWNGVLEKYPGVRGPISQPELESVVGRQMDYIAKTILPNEEPERRMSIMKECIYEENTYLAKHGGILFPKLRETLEELKANHRLFIVSNCQEGYIEAFLTAHDFWDMFEGKLCFGETGRSKGENIATVISEYGLKTPVYVGDTQGDKDASDFAGIPFIFAEYGFGKVDGHDAAIDAFSELPNLFDDENCSEPKACEPVACETFDQSIYDVSFEEAKASYGDRKWWVKFFVRPCCPPPGADQASRALESQRNMVRSRTDFTDEQKAELLALIDEGEAWYRTTPYWAKGIR